MPRLKSGVIGPTLFCTGSSLHLSFLSLSSLIITLANYYKRFLENSLVCISLIRPVVYLLLWPIAFWLIFILTNYRSDTRFLENSLVCIYFFVPFKSNYHSDQLLHKILGKLSCLHLSCLSLSSLIITLTNYHSDQLSLWPIVTLANYHSDQLSLWPVITLTNCHTKLLENSSTDSEKKTAAIFEGRLVVILWFSRVSCVSWKRVG